MISLYFYISSKAGGFHLSKPPAKPLFGACRILPRPSRTHRRSGLATAVAEWLCFFLSHPDLGVSNPWGVPQNHRFQYYNGLNLGDLGYPHGVETSILIIGLRANMHETMVFTIFDMIDMGLSGFNFFGPLMIEIKISP